MWNLLESQVSRVHGVAVGVRCIMPTFLQAQLMKVNRNRLPSLFVFR
ncbi:unnamed protein product [Nezara viridula]|uniref:Uncharacterized protein n=1 Tax=Nezara viridula TaxID=85310 RepID=A0A9P0HL37_NEZVI|nr:unnamed protein product [Nezara viridula]